MDAINEVLEVLKPRLEIAALRIDPSGRDTDDLMQVGRLKIWRALPGLRKSPNPSYNLLVWLAAREMKQEVGRIHKRIKYDLTERGTL